MQEYLDILWKGGVLIIPIVICSVIALGVFVERVIAMRPGKVFPPDLADSIYDLVKKGQYDGAVTVASQRPGALSSLVLACLNSKHLGRAQTKEMMEEVGSVELGLLGRWLGALSTIATVSPLLGLLGTVTGMIKVFKSVASVQDPQISQLAGGIWEALLTTVAGLVVAIPAYLCFRFLESRLERMASAMQEYGLKLLDTVFPVSDGAEAGKE